MANIFSLFGTIFIDNEKANKSIDETTNKAKKSSKSFAENLGNVVKSGAKVATAVAGATTAAIAGLTAMANQTAATADEIDKGSIRMGISTDYYQQLKYAAGQCGVEMTALEKAAKKLEGTDINMEDAMQQIMALSTAEERATKAGELFGDNIAYTLSPLIEQNTEDYEGLIQRANELGIVMGEDSVKAGVLFGDTMSDIKQSLGGAFNSIMSSLIPVIQIILDLIIKNMPTIQSMIQQVSPILEEVLQKLLPPMIELSKSLFPIIFNLINKLIPPITQILNSLLPVIIDLINMLLPPIVEIVELILPLLLNLLEPILPLLQPILNLLQPFIDLLVIILEPLTELLNMILPPLISLFSSLIEFILPGLQGWFNIVAEALSNSFAGAFENIKIIVSNVINIFKNIIDFIKNVFTGNWEAAWQNIKNIFSNYVSYLGSIFKTPLNFIIDALNVFIRGINNIKIPDWVPGLGGKGINVPLIRRLRVGMDYVPYDDMPALLHKGEAVLTADENKDYIESKKQIVSNSIDYGSLKSIIKDAFTESFKEFTGVVKIDNEKYGDFVVNKVQEVIYG